MGEKKHEDNKLFEDALNKLRLSIKTRFTEQTKMRYIQVAKEFLTFMQEKGKFFPNLDRLDVLEFIAEKADKCTGNSLQTQFRALKTIFKKWEIKVELEWWTDNLPKGSEPKNIPLYTEEERDSTLNKIYEFWKTGLVSSTDACLMNIGALTGIRRTQIARMKKRDWNNPVLHCPSAKGGRDVDKIFPLEQAEIMDAMLKERENDNSYNSYINELKKKIIKLSGDKRKNLERKLEITKTSLFIDSRKNKMSESSISHHQEKVRKLIGIDKPYGGIHAYRRGISTSMKQARMTNEEMNVAMGWKKGSDMPDRYAQITQDDVRAKAILSDPVLAKRLGIALGERLAEKVKKIDPIKLEKMIDEMEGET